MADDDLDQIRAYYVTLREVIILNPGGWDDAESRARVQQLCRSGRSRRAPRTRPPIACAAAR